MLLVKTYVGPSMISGLGLFADEDIEKGTVTWKFTDGFDFHLTLEYVENLPETARDFVKKYSALSRLSGQYVLYGDDTRFTNHSNEPNVATVFKDGEKEALAVADRDILKGEEITVNYKEFDESAGNNSLYER